MDFKTKFPHFFETPKIHSSVFIANPSVVSGDVVIGIDSSIWFNCVVRGDVNYIRMGERTNIQDLSMIHVSYRTFPVEIGNDVTVGHSVVLHGCKVGNRVLVGMGSTLLDGVEIGDDVLIGAGSLVTPNTKIPSGVKILGRPARVVADISEEEKARIKWNSEHYVSLSKCYLSADRKPAN